MRKILRGVRRVGVVFLVATAFPAVAKAESSPLDPSFGEGGILIPASPFDSGALSLARESDGRLLVGGSGSAGDLVIARYTADGTHDPSFGRRWGSGIYVRGSLPSSNNVIALGSGGRLFAGGDAGAGIFVVLAYRKDGRLRPGFGREGEGSTSAMVGNRARMLDLAIGRDGRIFAVGYAVDEYRRRAGVVAVFSKDGNRDRSFGREGVVRFPAAEGSEAEVSGIVPLARGRILLFGDVDGRLMVARLLPDGSLDRSFGDRGRVFVDLGGRRCRCARAVALARDRHRRIVLAANVSQPGRQPGTALIRLRPSGEIDLSFGRRGIVRSTTGSRLVAHDMAISANGEIVLAGVANDPATGEAFAAAVRYLPDGELDLGFGEAGFFIRDFGIESVLYSALAEPDGRVVLAGRTNDAESRFPEAESVYHEARFLLMRLMP